MLIAQLSDTHVCAQGRRVYDRIDTNATLLQAVEAVNRLRPLPDAVIVSGDLVEAGKPEQYAALRPILNRLAPPFYVLPGNHDARENLRAAFPDHAYLPKTGFLHYAIELGPLTLIALDTVVPGEDGGTLCAERLSWLESTLEQHRHRPVIVAMHHPPVPIGIDWLDRTRCMNAEGLAAVIGRHSGIERIVCGHVHRAAQIRFTGTVVATSPSTAYQVALELGHDGEPHLIHEPPAFLLHRWQDGVLLTHVVPAGDYGPPQAYG
jgi:3',5'-cyclic AMP phosphodiesterase CpdA